MQYKVEAEAEIKRKKNQLYPSKHTIRVGEEKRPVSLCSEHFNSRLVHTVDHDEEHHVGQGFPEHRVNGGWQNGKY